VDFTTYQNAASATFKVHETLAPKDTELLDWSLGLAGETGEVCELVKHVVFHHEPLDRMKMAKELGDVLWYISAIAKSLDIPLMVVAELNIAKLAHRHSGKYSHTNSADRHAKENRFESTEHYLALRSVIGGGK
jgi:NTP pyrophosphatase (non-canonical NTP hydrolase)